MNVADSTRMLLTTHSAAPGSYMILEAKICGSARIRNHPFPVFSEV